MNTRNSITIAGVPFAPCNWTLFNDSVLGLVLVASKNLWRREIMKKMLVLLNRSKDIEGQLSELKEVAKTKGKRRYTWKGYYAPFAQRYGVLWRLISLILRWEWVTLRS